jgi:hypothetical protein
MQIKIFILFNQKRRTPRSIYKFNMSTAINNQNTTNSLRPPIEDDEAVKNVAENYGKYFSFTDLTQQQVSIRD